MGRPSDLSAVHDAFVSRDAAQDIVIDSWES